MSGSESLKILILGANGFIGSALVTKIIKTHKNWEIYAMDLANDKLPNTDSKTIHFKLGDITKEKIWVEEQIEKCDVVLPLVAIANPAIYVTNPLRVFELDFEANLEIVKLCVKHKKRLIFPSTSEVYGMSQDSEFNEETSPLTLGPINKERWIYSCSKQLLDRVIYAHGKRDGLLYTLFRPFNWIGENQDNPHVEGNSSRVVTQFIGNIIYGRDFYLVDGGAQRRSFTYIDDGIDALVKIIENKNGAANGRIFNIGNPKNNYSIKELAEKTVELAAFYPKYKNNVEKIKIISQSANDYYGKGYQDLQNRVPKISAIYEALGWEPKVDLDTALKSILNYHLS